MSEDKGNILSSSEHTVVEEDTPSRRRFLAYLAGVVGAIVSAGILAPLVGMFVSPIFQRRKEQWLNIGELNAVAIDHPTMFVYKYVRIDGWYERTIYGTAYILRNDTELVALSNICTHLGCGVRWDADRKSFICTCHNGVFDMHGEVVSGPPPKPLTRFQTKIDNGMIQIRIERA